MSHAVSEAIKAAPPAIAGTAWLAGITLNEWAAIAAFIYTVLLITEKLYRWAHAWRARSRS